MRTQDQLEHTFKIREINPSIIHITVNELITDDVDEQDQAVRLLFGGLTNIFDKKPEGTFHLLFDLRSIGIGNFTLTPFTRQMVTGLLKEKQIDRAAAIGIHPLLAGVVNFFARASQKKHVVRLFKEIDEAIAWLNEPPTPSVQEKRN